MIEAVGSVTPAPLSYASAEEVRLRIGLYRVAVFCGVVPLAVGLMTLTLYALTLWDWLPFVGFLTFLVGGALCFIGLTCVTVFSTGVRRCEPDVRKAWWPKAARAAALLIANVPIAIGCAAAGIYLMDQFRVTLVNETASPITDITILSPGDRADVAKLDPGEKRSLMLSISNDGEISFNAMQNGQPISGTAAGYVSNGMGGKSTVTFTNTGTKVE